MTTDDTLQALCDLEQQIRDKVALVALLSIAQTARQQAPSVAYIELAWSDQGPWLVPDGYACGDGTEVRKGDGVGGDDLDGRLGRYASALDDTNEGTWKPFVADDTARPECRGDRYWLRVEDALAIEEPGVEASHDSLGEDPCE